MDENAYGRTFGILLLAAFVVYACLNVRLSSDEESEEEAEGERRFPSQSSF